MNPKEYLLQNADENYAKFVRRLNPSIDGRRILGVPMPKIRAIKLEKEEETNFRNTLPHEYFEEDLLHMILLNKETDPHRIENQLDLFLPHIHTWQLTDGLTFPKASSQTLLSLAEKYSQAGHSYTCRLAILFILKRGPRTEDPETWLKLALNIQGDEREIVLAKGWLLCEYMICCPDIIWKYFENDMVELPILRCGIQKCLDSRRISESDKQKLKELRKRR